MGRDKQIILHPFLLAIYPVLFLYSQNVDEVFPSYLLFPMASILFSTLLLFVLFRLKFKDSAKAGIFLSILVILFFSFDLLMSLPENLNIFTTYETRTNFLVLLYSITFSSTYFLLKYTKHNLNTATKLLNVVSLILVLIPLSDIMLYTVNATGTLSGNMHEFETSTDSNLSDLRDIYYIIPDQYPRGDILKEMFGFDNSEFLNGLKERGFYIASNSRSNYAATPLSLASSLNMEHVNYLGNKQTNDMSVPCEMILSNEVTRYLRSKGYTFINLKSTWGPTDNMGADIEYGCSMYGQTNEFTNVLLDATALQPFADLLLLKNMRKCRLYTFNQFKKISTMKEPTFTLAHIFAPHPPYLFDENGNPTKGVDLRLGCDSVAYHQTDKFINQLVFVNMKISEVIDVILAESQKQPIIMIQADHGFGLGLPQCSEDASTVPKEQMRERMAILNAYYLPDGGDELLYDSITPVNTFRIILNHYFNENLTLLEDESYFSTLNHPYDFIKIAPENE